jgi:hypothetical protein
MFKIKKLRDWLPTTVAGWLSMIFVFGSFIYAICLFFYLLFFMDASHPLGFQVNGENL